MSDAEILSAFNQGNNINPENTIRLLRSYIKDLKNEIEGLERNNLILADQLKKREGMWLAPIYPDPAMLKIAMPWFNGWAHMNNATRESNLEEAYKAMRDNWLSRNV